MAFVLIGLAFVFGAMKSPLRKRATTYKDESLDAQLIALWWAVLNVIVCAAAPLSFWIGIGLFLCKLF